MKLSGKQLAIYLFLLLVGAGAGVFSSSYLTHPKYPFLQLKNVTSAPSPDLTVSNPIDRTVAANQGNNVNFIALAVQKVRTSSGENQCYS